MSIQEIVQENKTKILEIAYKHGASNVRLFGSVAKGHSTLESDVDILVDMAAKGRNATKPRCLRPSPTTWERGRG
ncbi:nucleotidyltransferase family protein [Candidatus Viridilinea mediisalina]|uniref:nucleotidyltransferase family protein n=1 Tax=Candidatus Viridilinea mediisalina TaxID=2024553 RepID=UPI001C2C9DCD